MTRMLSGTLELHDIRDVEAFCGRAMDAELRARGIRLEPADREDLLAYIIGVAWELSVGYRPGRSSSFSSYAYRILRLRVADYFRERFGATRRGRILPQIVSLDAAILSDDRTHELRFGAIDTYYGTHAAGSCDPAEYRCPDLARLLSPRGGGRARTDAPSGTRSAGRSTRRTRVR